jgi:hypothetical protein
VSRDIARQRLRSLRIEGPPLDGPAEVARWLVAAQAQDFAGAKWSLALRCKARTDAEVEAAFNGGQILRTHLLRPTWHFVAREDLRWLVALTAPRVHAANAGRYRQLELDARTFRQAEVIFTRALAGGRQRTRDELRDALRRGRIATDGQRMAYLLMHAELELVICSGARRGKQFTYALVDDRAPAHPAVSRAEALAALAGRYFPSRGPATAHDFAKWASLTLTEARAGLEAVAPSLSRVTAGGEIYWAGPPVRARDRSPAVHLLSIFDELICSYRDRTAICAPADAKRLAGMGAALAYLLIVDGRVAGTWRRTLGKRVLALEVAPFRRLSEAEQAALVQAGEELARFLGGDRVLELVLVPPERR